MSLNPVEIELKKPSSFGHNKALARLLGDTYRPTQFSNYLSEGARSGNPLEVRNFVVTYDPSARNCILTWIEPPLSDKWNQYLIEASPGIDVTALEPDPGVTQPLVVGADLDNYGQDYIDWTIRVRNTLEESSDGPISTYRMYFVAPPSFIKAGFACDEDAIDVHWTYDQPDFVDSFTIHCASIEFGDVVVSDPAARFYDIPLDHQWCGQTLQFSMTASWREKTSRQVNALYPTVLGGANPFVCNFTAVYNPDTGHGELNWNLPCGPFTNYEIFSPINNGHSYGDTLPSDADTFYEATALLAPSEYVGDYIEWQIHTYTIGTSGASAPAIAHMYWVPSSINFTATLNTGTSPPSIDFSWNHPYTSYIDGFEIHENQFGVSVTGLTPDMTSASINVDTETWNNQTLHFNIVAKKDDKTSAEVFADPLPISLVVSSVGNNPGYYGNGFSAGLDVPVQIDTYSSRSIFMGDVIEIQMNDNPSLFTSGFSVSFWFKAAAMGDTAGYGLFKSSDSGEGINIGLSSSGFIYYGQTFSEFSHAVYDPGDNHLLTGWHFLVLSWTVFDNEGSPNNRYNLFIDGVQVVTDNDTQGASLFPNHNNFVIGQDNLIGSQGGQAYNGAMDDFRLTLENLDATSVSSMYNGAALVGNDVRVIYTFENEQIGDTDIIDSSTVYMPPG